VRQKIACQQGSYPLLKLRKLKMANGNHSTIPERNHFLVRIRIFQSEPPQNGSRPEAAAESPITAAAFRASNTEFQLGWSASIEQRSAARWQNEKRD
jgi:hypothetical protein